MKHKKIADRIKNSLGRKEETLQRVLKKFSDVSIFTMNRSQLSAANYNPALLESINTARGMINIVLAILTATPNGLVLVLFVIDPFNYIRKSPLNLMMTSLAFVDFLVGIALEPVGAYWHLWIASFGKPPFHRKYLQMAEALLLLVSVLHFVVISIERYMAVINPCHRGRRRVSRRLSHLCIIIIWGYSVVLIGTLQLFGKAFIRNILYCLHIDMGLCLLFTFFVLAVRKLKGKTENLAMQTPSKILAERLKARERKITKRFARLLLVFFICCLPWSLLIQIYPLCKPCKEHKVILMWMFKLSFILFLGNCACNPFLCALRLPNYRTSLRVAYSQCLPNRLSS